MAPLIVATDGSALNNPHGPAGWSWIIDKQRYNCGGFPKASNQVAEMYAILMAMTQIPLSRSILIQTDSMFCINTIGDGTKPGWMHGWKPTKNRPQWVKKDGKQPSNLKLVQALDKAITARQGNVSLEWVKGHADHPLNTAADQLCTRVTAAIKAGESIPVGPGWSNNATPSMKTVTKNTVKPVTQVKKVVTAPRKEVIIPKYDLTVNKCSSCNGPINPYSMECRCSY